MRINITPNQMTIVDLEKESDLTIEAMKGLHGESVIRLELDVIKHDGSIDVTGEESYIKQFMMIFGGLVTRHMPQKNAFSYLRR